MCFDKTGTLTEDGLDLLCVVPVTDRYFDIPVRDMSNIAARHTALLHGMATCHSLTIIDNQLMGDPLDLKMFESTGWRIEEHDTADTSKYNMMFPTVIRPPGDSDPDNDNQIGIIKEFPFSSSAQRMGVIVRKLTANNFEFYCKGSPEMLLNFCQPDIVPDDFLNILESYTQQGYRVIALAHRELTKMSYAKVQRAQRDSIEKDMTLLGLIVLENRLKEDTMPCISMLNHANIRTVMVTGDNILTAVSVARECGIVTRGQSVITINIKDENEPYYTLANTKGKPVENGYAENSITDSTSIVSLDTVESALASTEAQHVRPKTLFNNYRFALTGKTWSVIREQHPQLLGRLVTRGAVFARMSPEQKQQLIEELQGLGYCVAMCGDGANDCGALKAAHTGISLSDAESSVASPFTSKNSNITCVPSIIKEGRAALVTSFGIFKYMAAYSLCQFVSVMILYSIDSNLTDIQYLYIDLFIISIFAFFFGKTEAYSGKLVKETPLSSLISLSPVLSLVLQMLLVIIFQVIAFEHVQFQPWFEPFNHSMKGEGEHPGCYENYAVFAVSSFQYVILAIAFSKGKPYRESIFSNYGFIVSAIGITAFSAYLIVYPFEFLRDNFELVLPPTMEFRWSILIYPVVHFMLSILVEIFLIEHFVFKKLRFKYHNIDKSKRKYLAIERDLQSDSRWPMLTSEFKTSPSLESLTSTPNCTAEITIENENSFEKNHVLSSILERKKLGEVQLNPAGLAERVGPSTAYSTLSCDVLDARPTTHDRSKLSESAPNVYHLNLCLPETSHEQTSVLELNDIEHT